MRKLLAVPAVAVVAAVGLAATGCGSSTFDTADLQKKLSADFANESGVEPSALKVSCPDDPSADKGATFTCSVTDGENKQNVAITVTDGDGNVEWELQ